MHKPEQRSNPSSISNTQRARLAEAPRRYQSENLFAGARQVIIQHGEREYRLHVTASNKLILTT